MKTEQVDMLRKLLRDLFGARYDGIVQNRLARAQGYVDGYMAALLRSHVLTQREMLTIIAEERARVAGPAIRSTAPAAMNAALFAGA
jgi:hypothetical protein